MQRMIFPKISRQMTDRPYTRTVLIGILALAAIVRIIFFCEAQDNPMTFLTAEHKVFDQYNYRTMAIDLMQHRWLGSAHPGHSPVYSYIIAVLFSIFGSDINVVFLFQICYGVLAVYVFYRCAVLLFENKDLGLVTALVAALYGPLIFYECALLRESLIAYVNLTAFYFLLLALKKHKYRNYFWAGIFAGLSLVLRAGPLVAVVLGYVAVLSSGPWKARWARAGIVAAGIIIAAAPLTVRNQISGFDALTETSGPTLFWLGNTYDSDGIGLNYTQTQKDLAAQTEGRILPTLKVLWEQIKAHPQEYRGLWERKFKMILNGYEIPANLSYDLSKELSTVLRMTPFHFIVISPLALLGVILVWRKFKDINALYAIMFALTAFVLIFHIQGRYRIPFIPFYLLAAGYALYWLLQAVELKQTRALAAALVILAGFFAFTYPNQDILRRYFDGGIRAVDHTNMALAHLYRLQKGQVPARDQQKYLRRALQYYEKALAHLPKDVHAFVYLTQAMIYRDLEMRAHALDKLSKALELEPDHPTALREYQNLKSKIIF